MFNVPPQYELKRRNENNLVNYLLLSIYIFNVNYFCFNSLFLLKLLKNSRNRCSFQQSRRTEGKARSASHSFLLWIFGHHHPTLCGSTTKATMKLSITALLYVAATVAVLSTSSAVDAFTSPSAISLSSSRSRSMIGRSNLHLSAASDEDAAANSNKGVNSGNVAKTPVVGLPRPMEIGPQTPEEVKAKFGDRRKL